MSPAQDGDRRERTRTACILVLGVGAMLALDLWLLPRLTNVHFGDIEFTGWSGPMGSRLLVGDRPYVDFVLPIPPGSFVILALMERLSGRAHVLQELWLNGAIQLVMGILAYAMVRPVASRRSALLTALATLVTVIQLNKECAYDHTAQLVGWLSIALGIRALFGKPNLPLWVTVGVLAGLTVGFKQSTGIGILLGWPLAFLYLAGVERAYGGEPRIWKEPAIACASGIGMGLAGVWLMLVLLGSTARAFFQATFRDASILKGGPTFLAQNLVVYLFDYPAFPASLAFVAAAVVVGRRMVERRGSLDFGILASDSSPLRPWEIATVALVAVGFPIAGILALTKGPPGYAYDWILPIDRLKVLPAVGLITTVALFTTSLLRRFEPGDAGRPGDSPVRAGHALNAALIAAFSCSLLHNTSAPEFRPFYDNNAIIPLAFATLFVALDRADLRWASVILLFLFYVSAAGNKFFRAMTAIFPFQGEGHWAGMTLSDRGAEIARAARRVQELARPNEAVLVVPEDVQIAALLGRPRPPLAGAIVFVDQYAPRLAEDDIQRLDHDPPRVIVVHPRQEGAWQRFFRIWSGTSGAERVIDHVLHDLVPNQYVLDSSYRTSFLYEASFLDVYVLSPDGEKPTVPP